MTVTAIYHPAKNRIYFRRFDHDEAKARHAAGERLSDLAVEYGVSVSAIDRVVHNRQAKEAAANKKWRTGTCEECHGPAMRLVHGKKQHNPDGRVLCAGCRGRVSRTSVRFDGDWTLVAVRCLSLDCANGERWQPPQNFSKGTRYRDLRAGGFHNACRKCLTAQKRRYREANRAPCSHGCGRMVDTVDRRDKTKPLECLPCTHTRLKAEGRLGRRYAKPAPVSAADPSPHKERAQSVA